MDSAVSRTRRMSSSVIPSMSRRSFFERARRGEAGTGKSGRFVTPPGLLLLPRPPAGRRGFRRLGRGLRGLAVEEPHVVLPVRLPEGHGDDLGRGRRDLLADVLRLDRELAP